MNTYTVPFFYFNSIDLHILLPSTYFVIDLTCILLHHSILLTLHLYNKRKCQNPMISIPPLEPYHPCHLDRLSHIF